MRQRRNNRFTKKKYNFISLSRYLIQQKKESVHEKCGIVAVWQKNEHAPLIAKRGLSALQHRGQESAGITVYKRKGTLWTYIGMGLIPHVLNEKILKRLGNARAAIAHNRYSTTGTSTVLNAQPITLKHGKYKISIGHNGNIPDLAFLKKHVKQAPTATSDTAYVGQYLLEQRENYSSWEETIQKSLEHINGAYCFVILTEDGNIFGARDPYGIRPFCIGKFNSGWILASESVALDAVGAHFMREVARGEIIKIDPQGHLNSSFFGDVKRQKFCIFERIYFSRPDSYISGQRVRLGREESGRRLAKRLREKGIKADVVVPVFDSGYPAAKGVAEALKIPFVEAITTSHYVGRTFIQPGQENRVNAVLGKHNFTPEGIEGKDVVFVDDSAVRLTTSSIITKGLKNAGARNVHAAFASPPIIKHCDMGIDMKSKSELPASRWVQRGLAGIEKNASHLIHADSVTYLSIEDTAASMGGTTQAFYYHPFGGPHPIRTKQEVFPHRKRKLQGKPKILIFISGSGTNLQKVINQVKEGKINAEIINVVSNNSQAFGLIRAKRAGISTTILSSYRQLNDSKKRLEYEKKLIQHVELLYPDLIVLAGWMVVLGDSFLKKMQKLEISVINLHPGLMTEQYEDTIATSRGRIPILRGQGTHIIPVAFEKKFPVYGVTVHQVLAGKHFDVGPVIMKEEVAREENDTLESFEAKLHETEYRILPAAIKRTLHVINHHNIDISRGKFPW